MIHVILGKRKERYDRLMETIKKDPFRIYFPVAIFFLLFGSLQWALHGLWDIGDYPGQRHMLFFVGGYLYLSILGFLLTAIPRFTQTEFLTKNEVVLSAILIIALSAALLFSNEFFFWPMVFLGWMHLLFFAVDRFLRRKQNPPFTFLFVGLGVFFGALGSFLLILDVFFNTDTSELGRLLFFDAMGMAFVMGVGGRLIPGILGFTDIVKDQRKKYERSEPFFRVIPASIYISALLYSFSFPLQSSGYAEYAYYIRAVIICYFSFSYWKVHKAVPSQKWHGRLIRISISLVLLGHILLSLFPSYEISLKHFYYIGCYILLTLMVAARVVLAHSSEGLEGEYRKFPYLPVGLLLVGATVMRTTVDMVTETYHLHLGLAGTLLFIGVVIWSLHFLRRI